MREVSPVELAPDGRPPGRAGRDLPRAIAVGLVLGAVVLTTLYTVKATFLGVLGLAIGVGVWEVCRALNTRGLHPPLLPLLSGMVATLLLAYLRGSEGLVVAGLLTVAALVAWRVAEGAEGVLTDLAAALFVLGYVVFLAGFAVLLLVPPDGAHRVTAFIATSVCSDVGGYASGVLLGRHLMAPTVSPKKSWEGFAGSAVACAAGGAVFLVVMFHRPAWTGVLFGLAVVCSATLGDLGESMLKRDLGIKDMGALLPGHGGLMDRLDSLLTTAPVAWLVLCALAPAPH